eukprot:TRINITY_DN8725_c0_g1_i1.p1 TRINITY_DN8725_c0_g1~~TRINITY_DN8725_c0_g1_i1.p1  ORF type:complete len:709 (-),score=145.74 TRINITY_DN8725_c0_g1_i1:111-2162(-)
MNSGNAKSTPQLHKGGSVNAFLGTQSSSEGGAVLDPWEFLNNATLEQGLQCTNVCLTLKAKADADPNWLNENVDKFVGLLTNWAKKFNFEGGMMDPMVGPVTNLTLLFNLYSVHILPTTWTKLLPVYIALMCKKGAPPHMKQGLGSTFVIVKMQKPQSLYPIASMVLNSMFQHKLEDLVGVVRTLYPHQKNLIQDNVETIISWAENSQLLQGPMYAMEALETIAADKPEILLQFYEKFFLLMYNTVGTTAILASSILFHLVDDDPFAFTARTSEFRSVYKSYAGLNVEQFRGNIVKILGLVGRTTEGKAMECVGILRDFLEKEKHVDTAKLILATLKLIGGVYKKVLMPHRELILATTQSPYDSVREEATMIINYLDRADQKSLPNTGLMSCKAQAMIKALEDLALHDPEAETTTTSPRAAESTAARRLTAIEDPIQQRARGVRIGKEALEKKATEIKSYLSQVSHKMPIPKNFAKHEKLLKTMTLEFECSAQKDVHCLHAKSFPFVAQTHESMGWLKLAICAVHAGVSTINGQALAPIEDAYSLHEYLKDLLDPTFEDLVSELFLTPSELESMTVFLRETKCFDIFRLDLLSGSWKCCNCAKTSQTPLIKTEKTKKHSFERYHFHRFTWCVYCNQFIWGIGKQGYKCMTCKYRCHPECLQHVPDNCGQVDVKCHLSGKSARS